MHLIYEALKKTKGDTDADALIAAVKGMKWESPRGPVMIDPETRDAVETIYIRKVREGRRRDLVNVEIDKVAEREGPGQGSDEEVSFARLKSPDGAIRRGRPILLCGYKAGSFPAQAERQ